MSNIVHISDQAVNSPTLLEVTKLESLELPQLASLRADYQPDYGVTLDEYGNLHIWEDRVIARRLSQTVVGDRWLLSGLEYNGHFAFQPYSAASSYSNVNVWLGAGSVKQGTLITLTQPSIPGATTSLRTGYFSSILRYVNAQSITNVLALAFARYTIANGGGLYLRTGATGSPDLMADIPWSYSSGWHVFAASVDYNEFPHKVHFYVDGLELDGSPVTLPKATPYTADPFGQMIIGAARASTLVPSDPTQLAALFWTTVLTPAEIVNVTLYLKTKYGLI